ncbi:hypothetical protein PPACK8108_LOCUS1154 [Phakopsora pachyrhizi]|uniref:Uncharacterized protein n=1 Tax=Phakopsora pachyrhizi TaxID=170000 RepID=A0AAV0AHX8_PHAPC|nr:hypothetical protein PPACK8108_LOCUS1154 [Phakopsora pachyrhizi]
MESIKQEDNRGIRADEDQEGGGFGVDDSRMREFIKNKYLFNQRKNQREEQEDESSVDDGNDDDRLSVTRTTRINTFNFIRVLNDTEVDLKFKLSYFAELIGNNLILPFINGMMLGFGEIAAREFVGYYFGLGPSRYRYRYKDNRHSEGFRSRKKSSDSNNASMSSLSLSASLIDKSAPKNLNDDRKNSDL